MVEAVELVFVVFDEFGQWDVGVWVVVVFEPFEIEVEIRAVFDFAAFVATETPLNQVVSRLAFRSLTWKNSIPKRWKALSIPTIQEIEEKLAAMEM